MDKWTTGYFVSHGTKLHYYRTGGPKPPLVLLHGITDDGLCWAPVAGHNIRREQFSKYIEVVDAFLSQI